MLFKDVVLICFYLQGFCPIRDRSRIALEFKHLVAKIKQMKIFVCVAGDMVCSLVLGWDILTLLIYRFSQSGLTIFSNDLQPLETDISRADSVMSHLNEILDRCRKEKDLFPEVSAQDLDTLEQSKLDLMHLKKRWQAIFLWQDGPLVQAMRNGDLFLIDEISLADDSVLERLNSVLEPERKLVRSSFISHYVQIPCFFGTKTSVTIVLYLVQKKLD